MTRKIFQIVGWCLLSAIVILSLVPPDYRPVTALPHMIEHFSIFLATALALGLGASNRLIAKLAGLLAFTAAVELAQLLVPGRHARLSDFVIDGLGTMLGLGAAALLANRTAARDDGRLICRRSEHYRVLSRAANSTWERTDA